MNTLLTQVGADEWFGAIVRNLRLHLTLKVLFRFGLITRKQFLKRKDRVRRQWRTIAVESLKQ